MNIAVLGAGVLGQVYGLRLLHEGLNVSFVVRPSHLAESAPFVIEQVNGQRGREVAEHPQRVTEVPANTDVVLVTVRFHELFSAAEKVLERCDRRTPLVILTPMMPGQRKGLEARTKHKVVAAMPGIAGYRNEKGFIRYWIPAATSTLLDEGHGEPTPERMLLESLSRRLTNAGLPARLERDVEHLNAATTIAFFPLIAAICAGGGASQVMADKELFSLVLAAAKESDTLSSMVGRPAAWTSLLLRFVGPFTLKPAVRLAERLFPEALLFVDAHFGPKLRAQHLAMGEAIFALARERGLSMPSLERLMDILRTQNASKETVTSP